MPREERVTRNSALRSVVWRDTAAVWATRFLDELRG
jgi:trehalose-6-phosphate synthase